MQERDRHGRTRPVLRPEEARQASNRTSRVFIVLGVSLTLVIIGFAIVYWGFAAGNP